MRTDFMGLSGCTNFVETLINLWSIHSTSASLGVEFLARRQTTISDVSGFKTELVSGGQGGAVSRHIYGHAGAALAHLSLGSYYEQGVDYAQRFLKGRTTAESKAEITGDIAGRAVAGAMSKAYKTADRRKAGAKGSCPNIQDIAHSLNEQVQSILCAEL